MEIGILSKNYAAQRLFLNKIKGATYKDIRFYNYYIWRNAHLWFLRTIGKLNMSPEEEAAKLFYDYKSAIPTGCDVFHFFNTINHDKKKKWIVSVESAVPWALNVTKVVESSCPDFSSLQKDKYVRNAIETLARENCLAMMPLSQCSCNIQKALIRQFPEYEKAILNKLVTLLPPQELQINSIEEKGLSYTDDEIFTFVYVGRNFFRKGGRDTVEVLAKLHKKYDFRLILISALDRDEAKYERTDSDVQEAKSLIAKNQDWIEYHESLPNAEVLEKLKRAHVALLPTWMDTFAYSVLECQACGTPVVSTSLRALTEINDESVGWLINVPVNNLNNPLLNNRIDFKLFEEQLQAGLEQKVVYILEHRLEIRQKAEMCINRIKINNSPTIYAHYLQQLYDGNVLGVKNTTTDMLNNLTGGVRVK